MDTFPRSTSIIAKNVALGAIAMVVFHMVFGTDESIGAVADYSISVVFGIIAVILLCIYDFRKLRS